MFALILGIILLLSPFVFLGLFPDKKTGFVKILFFVLIFQSVLGIFTQSLHIFYYGVIFWATLVADIAILIYLIKHKTTYSLEIKKWDWIAFAVFIVALATLYQVHFNYNGKIGLAIDTNSNFQSAEKMKYAYPYFSDEWYSVSLISGAESNHFLPIRDPLTSNGYFPNLEIFFHSLVAELVLILGLDPLAQYEILAIFINALIIFLAYLLLRINNASKLASSASALSILYITCGANFPGLWHLIPLNSGILFALLGFCFISSDSVLAILAFLAAALFYPPLFLFFALAAWIFLHKKFIKKRKKNFEITIIVAIAIFILTPLFLAVLPKYYISRIFFISFSAPYIPNYYFYYIIPWPMLVCLLFGLNSIFKSKKWLWWPLILGVVYWFCYSLTDYRFFAEYERIAVFTSILVCIAAGFGIDKILNYFKMKPADVIKAQFAVMALFLILVPFYTQINGWNKLNLSDPVSGKLANPKPPANNYLTQNDLEIFSGIKGKIFLGVPWKGVAIGVATGNYPIVTKKGTISLGSDSYLAKFASADCASKTAMAKKKKINYVYLYRFDCPSFEKIAESKEGFVLYKVN